MASVFSDNINFIGDKPNFDRDKVSAIAQLASEEPAQKRYPYGHIVFCEEDGCHYKFNYNHKNPPAESEKSSVTGWFVPLDKPVDFTNLEESVAQNDERLSQESERALAVENALSEELQNEIARATAAENALSGRISDNVDRIADIESVLSESTDMLDTLENVAAWIEDDATGSADVIADVQKNSEDIYELKFQTSGLEVEVIGSQYTRVSAVKAGNSVTFILLDTENGPADYAIYVKYGERGTAYHLGGKYISLSNNKVTVTTPVDFDRVMLWWSGTHAGERKLLCIASDDATLQNKLDSQRTELIKRIQGTSEKSSASKDSFKVLGSFTEATLNELISAMDAMHAANASSGNEGTWRAYIGNDYVTIRNIPVGYTADKWMQIVSGRFTPDYNGKPILVAQYREWVRTHNYKYDDFATIEGWSAWQKLTKPLEADIANLRSDVEDINNAISLVPKLLGTYSTISDLLAVLDDMCPQGGENTYEKYIAYVGKEQVTVENNKRVDGATTLWHQTLRCHRRLSSVRNSKNIVYGSGGTGILIDYAQEFNFPSYSPTTSLYHDNTVYGEYCRKKIYYSNTNAKEHGVWNRWEDMNNPYRTMQAYAKRIAIFGGSFVQYMGGVWESVNTSKYAFTHAGRKYFLVDYLAERLNAKCLDDYAVGGNGNSITTKEDNSPIFTYNTYYQVERSFNTDRTTPANLLTDNSNVYDIYVIMLGINDYAKNIEIGKATDNKNLEGAEATFCSSLKKSIDYIRANAPNAKILMITPFKAYKYAGNTVDFGWNPDTFTTNDKGYKFLDYVRAFKEVAYVTSCPCFDLLAMQNFSGTNVSMYYTDGTHPNGLGYYKVADMLAEFIATGVGHGFNKNSAVSNVVVDDVLSPTSSNPVQNKVVAMAINTEQARATAAENALSEELQNETARATAAENSLQSKINDEISRAATAESTLQSNIDTEKKRAETKESELQNDIATVTPKNVTWDSSRNLNESIFRHKGVYKLNGERIHNWDNVPIQNNANGHTIDCRLIVLDSSLPQASDEPQNDDGCITQILMLSNRVGGDGGVYIRTARGLLSDRDINTVDAWKYTSWKRLQENQEVGVIYGNNAFDNYLDNGIVSGVRASDLANGIVEAFVMIVINNYPAVQLLNSAYGGSFTKSVSQFKYAVDMSGAVSYKSRALIGDTWTEWSDINGGSDGSSITIDSKLSDTSTNAVQNKVIAQAIEEAVQRGRLLALRDLYIAAGAMYNDTNEIIKRTTPWEEEVDHLPNHYYLNGLGDVDEDEMFQIYIRKDWISDFFNSSMKGRMFQGLNPNVRTVFGAQYGNRWASGVSINTNGISNPFAGWSKLEVLLWKNNSMIITDGTYCFTSDGGLFHQNNKLKVIGCMKAIKATSFAQCPNLQEIRLYYTAYNIDFSLNPNISKKTLLYLIEKVDPKLKTAITIKLHAAVFAKCSEGGEWYEEVRTALNTVNGYTDENGEEHAGTITGGGSIGLVSA